MNEVLSPHWTTPSTIWTISVDSLCRQHYTWLGIASITAENGEKSVNRRKKVPNLTETQNDHAGGNPVLARAMVLAERAEKGDHKALAEFKALSPSIGPGLIEAHGNLAKSTEQALIRAFAGNDLLVADGLQGKVNQWREKLAGLQASALEALLVERILCCWIQAHHADYVFAVRRDATLAQAEFLMRRQDQANRRFLQACKALAQVRRLLGPNIQVNIAEKQINVVDGSRK